ncbi:hypothetical protein E2562_005681 [Oryza meyeriana var. granulata]|uniref:Uncharacterized protein n=1 Tax=Oryza meyeriana var. granulata TaxID=110450 RepID=A0A6G1F484_9ORYZ|nr:hypothetical protein E2562_005681 [Oryza meyeriana var. granulata]
MQPGGHNPRGNAAPFSRYSNGAGFRRGISVGPNATPYHHPAAEPPHHVMTPQQRDEVLLQAGRLAAEYLVDIGELPLDALHSRGQPAQPLRHPARTFQGYQYQRPPPPYPFDEGLLPQHLFQAPGPSQHDGLASPLRPQRQIAKRSVVRATFQGRGRAGLPFPPPGRGRARLPPPGASGAAAPGTSGAPGQGAEPGGVGVVRGDGFDAPATAGTSSSQQPSLQSGGAAHGPPEKGQPGEHSNSGGSGL